MVVPQGLKPDVAAVHYGTAEAVPFQNRIDENYVYA
jgi:hypothetical protein